MHKLLVVDDENDICDFVKTFFKDRGFHVVTALNGEEAISMAKKERPDLILHTLAPRRCVVSYMSP